MFFDEDSRLLRRLKAGDTDAYAQVAERFRREIWVYLYRLTRNNEQAEDLSQEVAIILWRSTPEFRGVSSLKAWLYRTAYNLFVSQRRIRNPETTSIDCEHELSSPEGNPQTILDGELLDEEIEAALDSLPDNEREAVILTKMHGFKLKEAAEVMEIPLGTVQWCVHSGLKRMRKSLIERSVDHVAKQAQR